MWGSRIKMVFSVRRWQTEVTGGKPGGNGKIYQNTVLKQCSLTLSYCIHITKVLYIKLNFVVPIRALNIF